MQKIHVEKKSFEVLAKKKKNTFTLHVVCGKKGNEKCILLCFTYHCRHVFNMASKYVSFCSLTITAMQKRDADCTIWLKK